MLTELKKYINEHKLFDINDKLLLALSGGLDSVVLAHLLVSGGYDVAFAHVNFQLRSDESEEDEAFCKDLASKLGKPFYTIRFDTKKIAEQDKKGTQETARTLRYTWFESLKKENGFQYIVTAHHLNDAVETSIFHLAKGAGLQGLSGIPLKKGNVVRPFLFATREKISAYAEKKKITWREDSSNSTDKYSRNLIRHQVVPVLKQINPSLEATLERSMSVFYHSQILINSYFENFFEKELIQTSKDEFKISIEAMTEFRHKNLSSFYLLKKIIPTFSALEKNDIDGLFTAESGSFRVVEDWIFLKDRSYLIVYKREQNAPFQSYTIESFSQKVIFPNGKILAMKVIPTVEVNFSKDKNIAYFDESALNFPLKYRKWQDGDSFKPFGMKGKRQKISDLLINLKYSLLEKENVWVLCDANEEIVWVVGSRNTEMGRVTKSTKNVLVLEIGD